MLELELQFGVRTERVARNSFALGLNSEHFAGVIKNGSRSHPFGAGPFRIGERTQSGRSFANADISGNEISLFKRNVELRFIGKFEGEDFLLSNCSGSRAGSRFFG